MTDCQFECLLHNNDQIHDKSKNNFSLINPLFIDDNSIITINLCMASLIGFGFAIAAILLAKGNIFKKWIWPILAFLSITGGVIGIGVVSKDFNDAIDKNKKEMDMDDNIIHIYYLNMAFWACWTFLSIFILGISILSSYGLHVIIEGSLGIFLNYALLLIPPICWIILLVNTKNINCKPKGYDNNNDIPAGKLPICDVNEDYTILLQNIYGLLICGLIVILGLIGYSLI